MSEQVFTNCTAGGPISVYVRDGKVVRVRPIVIDEKDFKSWTIEAKGQRFSPPRQVKLASYVNTARTRLYSDERIKYPMKRVHFDPKGDRHLGNEGGHKWLKSSMI